MSGSVAVIVGSFALSFLSVLVLGGFLSTSSEPTPTPGPGSGSSAPESPQVGPAALAVRVEARTDGTPRDETTLQALIAEGRLVVGLREGDQKVTGEVTPKDGTVRFAGVDPAGSLDGKRLCISWVGAPDRAPWTSTDGSTPPLVPVLLPVDPPQQPGAPPEQAGAPPTEPNVVCTELITGDPRELLIVLEVPQ